jgi:hypothetical protein
MKHITKILVVLVALVACTGCFKEEKQGTRMRIELSSQNVKDDPVMRTTSEIEGYAFYVPKGTKWEVKTWEDALDKCATNKDKPGEVLTEPDVIGTWDANSEYQLSLDLKSRYTALVVVDVENKLYAYRDYETPINWPETETELHLYAWRKTGQANGWTVVNANE